MLKINNQDQLHPSLTIPRTRIPGHRNPRVLFALLAIYLIWGTTYLATRFAVETMPPLLMIAARYLTAGLFLHIVARRMSRRRPTWSEWRHAAILGISVMGACNGIVALVADKVPTGAIACIFATGPFVLSIVSWIGGSEKPPGLRQILSMGAGFAGVFLMTGLGSDSSGSSNWIFTACLVLATFFWAVGTVWTRKRDINTPIPMIASMQMVWGGGFSLAVSLLKGEWAHFSPSGVSMSAALALLYLIIFGTLIAFLSYNYLLRTTNETVVASHAYVNPLVAMVAGVLVLGERLTAVEEISALLILSAVFLSLKKPKSDRNGPGRIRSIGFSLAPFRFFRGSRTAKAGA